MKYFVKYSFFDDSISIYLIGENCQVIKLRRSVPRERNRVYVIRSVSPSPTYRSLGKDEVVGLRGVSRPRTRNAFQLLKSFKR